MTNKYTKFISPEGTVVNARTGKAWDDGSFTLTVKFDNKKTYGKFLDFLNAQHTDNVEHEQNNGASGMVAKYDKRVVEADGDLTVKFKTYRQPTTNHAEGLNSNLYLIPGDK